MFIQEEKWFKTWFDSPYYHILYQERNYLEAERFISHLLGYLKLPKNTNCLDLACGNGRHAIFLNKNELKVTGIDLSPQSIKMAKPFENETLFFDVHDMRKVYKENEYDVIFNLFTSFGYFSDYSDNKKVLSAVNTMLTENGKFIIDFLNAHYVLENLVKDEEKVLNGIKFHISRNFDGEYIIKNIRFADNGKEYHFQERVQAISKENFEELLDKTGFEILDCFGDYNLSPYDKNKSDRLIIITKKK